MNDFKSYVICTSPRSGSTLLCKLLAETSVAGVPESYFHRSSIAGWMSAFDLTAKHDSTEQAILKTIVQSALAKGRSENGMFGLRLQRRSAEFLIQKLGALHPECASESDRFHVAFGCTAFVHLTRRDKIEQAVSYVKAEQSGLWHMSVDGTELERKSPATTPIYDAQSIMACIAEFTENERQWTDWFELEKLNPIKITYENLSAQPGETVTRILESLRLDGEAAEECVPSVMKLADDVSREWVARFRLEFPKISSLYNNFTNM